MKRILLLLTFLAFGGGPLLAQQQEIKEKIDSIYPNRSYQEYIYLFSPQTKLNDERQLEEFHKLRSAGEEPEALGMTLSQDTTFGYTEIKAFQDSAFLPSSFFRRYVIGDTSSYVFYNNSFSWIPDSSEWEPRSLSRLYNASGRQDSAIYDYFTSWNGQYQYSSKLIYPEVPARDADQETRYESKNPAYYGDSLWHADRQQLRYRNEDGRDTLYQEYTYYDDLADFSLTYEYRSEFSDTRDMYRYDYFNRGVRTQYTLNETTLDHILYESKNFDEGEMVYWDYSYTKLGDDFRYLYSVSKEWDSMQMTLIPEDSTNYEYLDNDTRVISDYYIYEDSVYVWDQQYRSYLSLFGEEDHLVDSTMVFDVVLNEETQEREIGSVTIKSTFEYNEEGRQTAINNFQSIGDTLVQTSRSETEYKLINNFSTIVAMRSFARNQSTEELFLQYELKYSYDEERFLTGYSQVYYDAEGDTTNASIFQREMLPDFSFIEIQFGWDYQKRALRLFSIRVVNRRHDQVENSISQNLENVYTNFDLNGNQYISRNFVAQFGYPGIFNDGPVQVAMGDTLRLTVSALNPDLTIPEVAVTDMPASATFDPETREFFWVVDEEDPTPMTYTAVRGGKSVTTQVEFVTEAFTVSAETGDEPSQFELSQNYPNPFNPSTNIQFSLPQSGLAMLKVYNLLGQEVATLVNERLTAGAHTVQFNAGQLASGVYIYRLTSGSFVQTRKMMLIK